jgi:hypothetical protein
MTPAALMTAIPSLPAPLENTSAPSPSPQNPDVQEWTAIIQTGWQLALVPMMAWSSLYAASWQFWERSPGAGQTRADIPGASGATNFR